MSAQGKYEITVSKHSIRDGVRVWVNGTLVEVLALDYERGTVMIRLNRERRGFREWLRRHFCFTGFWDRVWSRN
jgi:hypothetical protein